MTGYQKARLFLVSSLALTMAGVGSALRANTAADLQRVFFDPIDKAHSGEMIANVLGLTFLGFAFTRAIDEAAAAMYALQHEVLAGQGIPVQGVGREAYRS